MKINKLNNFSFIRGSEASNSLTSEWMDAFDDIMAQWLELLIPAYNTCKNRGVSFFEVANVIDDWSEPERFTEDGFSYLLWNAKNKLSRMSFDAEGDGKGACDWRNLLRNKYPHLYDNITPDFKREMTETSDWAATLHYFSRYLNCREPYNFIANRVRGYFKVLTCDSDVDFSLGGTSYFALDDAGKN